MSFGAVPLIAASAIISAEIVPGLNVWMAVANGIEAVVVFLEGAPIEHADHYGRSPTSVLTGRNEPPTTCLLDRVKSGR